MDVNVTLRLLVICAAVCLVRSGGRARDKPRNVTAELVNATTVVVRWDPPRGVKKCPVASYLVRLKDESSARSTSRKVNNARTVVVRNLREDTDYLIRVVAVGCRGKSQPTKWASVRTLSRPMGDGKHTRSEARIPGKPSAVRTRTMTDAIIMSWQPPDDDVLVRGYMVGYGEGVPDVNWQYVSANTRNFTIRNLKPSRQYVISLRAFNNFGKGPVVYDLIYTREEDAPTVGPLTPPIGLKSRVLSPHTVWLEWIDPSLGRAQKVTDNRYYVVSYTPVPKGQGSTVTVKSLNVVLYHLRPHTTYEFKVRTHKLGETTVYSISNYNTTFESAPGSPPEGVKLVSSNWTTTAVNVTWRPPNHPNGVLTGYNLLYTPWPAFSDKDWAYVRLEPHDYSFELRRLLINITYGIRMQAINKKGYGPFSDTLFYFSGKRTTPAPVVKGEPTGEPPVVAMTPNLRRTEQVEPGVLGQFGSLPQPQRRTRPGLRRDVVKPKDEEPSTDRMQALSTTLDDNNNELVTTKDVTGNAAISVNFTSVVSHKVTAVITWHEMSKTCAGQATGGYHYVVSYYPLSDRGDKKRTNTSSSMVMLDNLLPGVGYGFDVAKVDDVTKEITWMHSGTVDTQPNGNH